MCNCTSENLEIPGLVLTHHPGMTENGLLRFIWKATWLDVNHFTAADTVGVHRAIGKHFLLRLFEHNRLSGLSIELIAGNHSRLSAFWSGFGGLTPSYNRPLLCQCRSSVVPGWRRNGGRNASVPVRGVPGPGTAQAPACAGRVGWGLSMLSVIVRSKLPEETQ